MQATERMRVLLVDEKPLFLAGLRHLLTAHGLDVVGTAADGLEALVKARLLHPDLIVIGVQMSVCDGQDTTRRIAAELPEVRFVMLARFTSEEDLLNSLGSATRANAGHSDLLPGPA